MEAIGGGASVLAFVLLGLKSAKIIYELLNPGDDGKTIARDVRGLQSTLERLARCRVLAERPDEALEAKIVACANDMESFAKKLSKLAILDNDGRLRIQWKKVKTFLSEKDMAKMRAIVVGHTAGLNLHLQALERHVLPDSAPIRLRLLRYC